MQTKTGWLVNKKFWVPRKYAEDVQDVLLSIPEIGYDAVTKKVKTRKKFLKKTKFVAFFVNFDGALTRYEVQRGEEEPVYLEFKVEPENEADYMKIVHLV